MIKKILKWTGIIIGSILLLVTIVVAMRQDMKYEAPYPDIKASADSSVIARGKYLALGPAHCASCHADPANLELVEKGVEVPLSGGNVFNLPVGNIYVRNITPDKETGIGRYTDAEIARELRYGVRPDGSIVMPFMPFHNVSDEDLTAIISFLRSQPPVKNKVPENTTNVLGKIVKAFLLKPEGPTGVVPKKVKQDTSAAYGEYLATSVANCKGCHTPRDMMTGAFTGEPFSGGMIMGSSADDKYDFITPNLTPDSTGRLFGWTQDMFIKRFRMGKIYPGTHMPWGPFSRMSDDELKAIYNYLQTVKPVKNYIPQTRVEKKKDKDK
ncbi:MAG TPA: cytochrome c [Chitinophagaceae bacterium]|nr:cytochrome c [Chitinophagaceae bacterium]